MADQPIYADVGRQGFVIPLAPLRARIRQVTGGTALLDSIMRALTVTEKVHAGRPRGAAFRAQRKAFVATRDTLTIPRIRGAHLLRTRVKGQLLLAGARDGGAHYQADGSLKTPIRTGESSKTLTEVAADNRPLPAPRRIAEERLDPEEPLYEYQEATVEHLCMGPFGDASVAAHTGVVYLQMDTGLGKSRVGCAVIARRGEPALIVVPTAAIGVQWLDELRILFPAMVTALYHNPPKGSKKAPPGPLTHDVVVIIINTFRDKDPSFMEGFGTVILDEAHEYHSAQNSRALWLAQTRVVLGLSATPEERPDGLDKYVHLHLGPVLYPKDIPGFDVNAVSFKGEVRIVDWVGHPEHCVTATTPAGTMSAVVTIGNIVRDPARVRLVAAEVARLFRLHETADAAELRRLGLGPRPADAATPKHPAGEVRRHGVFVFAELRDALPAIRDALHRIVGAENVLVPELDPETKEAKAAPAIPVSILRGGVKSTAVNDARAARSHVVLTTYGFSRRGISLPDMTSVVLATPRRNGSTQVLGRILRRGSDESIVRQVVDIVDTRTGLKGQVSDRRKVYKLKGYEITKASATWEEYADPAAAHTAVAGAEDDTIATELAGMSIDALLAMAMGGPMPDELSEPDELAGQNECEYADGRDSDAACCDELPEPSFKVRNRAEDFDVDDILYA
jgi:superfamily II DNA or RNA helicase